MLEEADRVAQVLRSLPEAALRAAYLRDYLTSQPVAQTASVFDALLQARSLAREEASEPALAIVLLLAQLYDEPSLEQLGQSSAEHELASLGRLLRRAPVFEAEEVVTRTPDYGRGRELSLGERKFLARRPSRLAFDKLLRDPHPHVIQQLLENPRATEDDVVRLAARRPAVVEVLGVITKSRWLGRPRVRTALIYNPGTPSAISVPLLGASPKPELRDVLQNTELHAVLRSVASELIGLRSLRPSSE